MSYQDNNQLIDIYIIHRKTIKKFKWYLDTKICIKIHECLHKTGCTFL